MNLSLLFYLIIVSLLENSSGSNTNNIISCLNKTKITCYLDNQVNALAENESIWNSSQLNLKIISFKNVNLLNENIFIGLDLYSLDVSNNQDTLEDWSIMEAINSFTNLTALNLSYNRISQTRTNQFYRLAKLTMLDLSYNQIFYFEANSFAGLSSLVHLNLSRNKLTEIEENDLDNMPLLECIDLDFNKMKKIRNNVFSSMKKLSAVLFRSNKIKTIDKESFKDLIFLETVKLNANKLKSINSLIAIYSNVSDLDLSDNLVETFEQFQQITTITSLNLAKNNISQISDYSFIYFNIYNRRNVYTFLKLLNLSLAFNKLNQISDKTFYGLNSLKYIDLSNNMIESLSSKFLVSTPKLISLNLKNNRIKYLDGIDWRKDVLTSALKIIDLEKNLLTEISLSNFPDNLIEINFKLNRLNKIDVSNGFNNADLSISLDDTYFLSILKPNNNLTNNNLTFFFLQDKCLTAIRKEMFAYLKKLLIIYLKNNQIRFIENNTFTHLNDLNSLYLQKD